MNDMTLDASKYPIGRANIPKNITESNMADWIRILESFPNKLTDLTQNLSEEQLDTPYRKGGWTILQVVHHLVDSHTNSYIRFKWALTEKQPVIKAYYEDRWAELQDYKAPVSLSLDALKSLHAKWVYLLRNLSPEELQRTFIHPETNQKISLQKNIGIYAWHSEHHYAHIEKLLLRKGWLS